MNYQLITHQNQAYKTTGYLKVSLNVTLSIIRKCYVLK